MNRLAVLPALLAMCASQAQQTDDFDYFEANRTTIRNGVQAILMCNGLFTSGRAATLIGMLVDAGRLEPDAPFASMEYKV